MRSPVIAFGIFAASVSPSLIAAAPTGPSARGLPAAPAVPGPSAAGSTVGHSVTGPLPGGMGSSINSGFSHGTVPSLPSAPAHPGSKRAVNAATAGGSASTGNTNSSNGGSTLNEAGKGEALTSDASSKSAAYGLDLV